MIVEGFHKNYRLHLVVALVASNYEAAFGL